MRRARAAHAVVGLGGPEARAYARGIDLVEERLDGGRRRVPRASSARRAAPRCAPAASACGRCSRCSARAAAQRRASRVLRGAAAVELLHMATLVHDDVLDRAELRRGRPTVAHALRGRRSPSRPATSCWRAPSQELVGAGDRRRGRPRSAPPPSASREGEVLQRDEAHDVHVAHGGLRAPLRAQDRRPLRGRLPRSAPCSRAPARGGRRRRRVRPPHRPRLPGLRRHPRLQRRRGDTGKRPGTDVRDGTVTLPLIFALEVRPELAEMPPRGRPRRRRRGDRPARRRRAPAPSQRARGVALRYIEDARAVLAACPDPVERDLLGQVAAQVVDRYS